MQELPNNKPVIDKYDYYLCYIINRLNNGLNEPTVSHCIELLECLSCTSYPIYRGRSFEDAVARIRKYKEFFELSDREVECRMAKEVGISPIGIPEDIEDTLNFLNVAIPFTNNYFV